MAAPVSASLLPLARSAPSFAGPYYNNKRRIPMVRVCCTADDDEEVNNMGVNMALSMLKFYKREISPLLPSSCRYVPTCSDYSMQAYKRYGVAKDVGMPHRISFHRNLIKEVTPEYYCLC
ncbi:putative membrane protein insertion efficiency factor isoform X3 [Hordeum vulgare subsp. vulgare]|uniref:Membrane protein insertion efficiency factor YidD n=1 Tax=Hordeum vulgare subsp. vulgare TaxID=112509 RepID=A0A8I6XDZ0_HORVV|nr:putative membrane protein insertion efficiency factor isoform X3 [Hordeum vulgare subsp. vulgare]